MEDKKENGMATGVGVVINGNRLGFSRIYVIVFWHDGVYGHG